MNKMSMPSRIITGIASLALISTYFLPVWFIFLIAPQYPEGLTMNIWLNKLTGQVEIINGLNHYIGMKHISVEMFPEFKFLVYVVAAFILFGLIVSITGKRSLLFAFVVLTVIGSAAAMYDLYRWGYDYGHNLDPKAAIQVPGLSYQPPVIGHKMLLNFDAYSYPDTGGWIVIGVGIVFFLVWGYEWYRNRKSRSATTTTHKKSVSAAAIALIVMVTASCNSGPEPIAYGKDACSSCKMTIMDPKFGAEVVTKKGRTYKFDDALCVRNFLRAGTIKDADIAQTVFTDYENTQQFTDAKTSFFLISPQLKSPMNGNAAAFASQEQANKTAARIGGSITDWNAFMQANQQPE